MGALSDSTKYVEIWLSERGLDTAEIRYGMRLLFGEDWNAITPSELFFRLRALGSSVPYSMPMLADELEAFVRGALMLEDIYGSRRSSS